MTNIASASDTKFDSNNQLKYLSYQNCQENFLNCLLNISNINNQHNNYEQQHSENSFRLLNSDSFIISNKDLYFDSTNSNQPELKRVKVKAIFKSCYVHIITNIILNLKLIAG